jgi:ribose transport system substrate-binding protein
LVSDAAVVAAAVTAAEQPVAWQLSSAPSITVGTGAQGKRVAVITKDINGFIQAIKDGISAAAGKVGMTTLQSNPAGNAADVARQISQAIAQHTSAIITVGFTTAEITAPLQQAHSAGIPVVQLFVTDPGAPPASATSSGVFAYVSPCYSCIGATMADIVIRDSGGRANTVFVNAPDVGVATLEANGFTAEMRQHCPSCTTKVSDAPIAQWGTQIPSIATAAAADPRVNYIVPVFDTASPLIVPALAAANATGRVKLVSSNGDQAQLQDMKAASTPRWVGNIGVNGAWIGWASMDEVLRALTNHPALADEKIGFRAFTPTNVGSLDLTQNPSTWYGGTDFAANYLKLWGLS